MNQPGFDRRSFFRSVAALAGMALLPRNRADAANTVPARVGDPKHLEEIFSLQDAENLARTLIPEPSFTYIQSGVGAEVTLRWNQERFNDIRLHQRVLADLGNLISFSKLPVVLKGIMHPADADIAVKVGAALRPDRGRLGEPSLPHRPPVTSACAGTR